MSPPLHQRLVNDATEHGTAQILQQMPAAYSREMEQAIHRGVRQAVLYYALGLESMEQRLHPLGHGKARV